MAKRTVQMKRQGIPKFGMRPGHFHGFRNKHWREIRKVVGYDANDLPIVEYSPCAMVRR